MAEQKQNRIRRFKLAPPPPELPIYGSVKPEDCSFIGKTNYEAALQEQKYIFYQSYQMPRVWLKS
jgi:hypothetical protein